MRASRPCGPQGLFHSRGRPDLSPSGGPHTLKQAITVAAIALAALAFSASTTNLTTASAWVTPGGAHPPVPSHPKVKEWRHKVAATRANAIRHAHMIGLRPTSGHRERHVSSVRRLRHMVRTWSAKNAGWVGFWRTHFPKLMCIHSYEGAWNAYSPAGYYGGLQMDWSFMRTYGPDKLARYGGRDARYWSPGDQVAVAMRAVRVRGYTPWSTSASACGVL